MSSKDESLVDDKTFFDAHMVLAVGKGDLENAAKTVTKYALKKGDRGALSLFLALFADFVDAGKTPPTPMLEGLRDVFNIFRGGASMNDAFSLSAAKKGRPAAQMFEREWARTNASLVTHFIKAGDTLEVAIEKTASFRAAPKQGKKGNSESKIKRDYLKFRRLNK